MFLSKSTFAEENGGQMGVPGELDFYYESTETTTSSSKEKKEEKKGFLPKTGMKQDLQVTIGGGILVSIAFVLISEKKRKIARNR